MLISRIAAVLVVLVAVLWIGSGVVGRAERSTEDTPVSSSAEPDPLFRVGVLPVETQGHARSIVLSGRTEADKRATAVARASGVIIDLKVRRGSVVKAGDVVAVLSDEAREAQVEQAAARLEQRRTELQAKLKLIERGVTPALEKPQLEAELRAAAADLAQAEAERDKARILAPIAGVVNDVPVEQGQALQPGAAAAEIIALDPMLAVVEVSERQLGGVKVGDPANVQLITGQTAEGRVRFISRSASSQTRTYRVDVEIRNRDAAIADGISAEVALMMSPVEAARLPRSALTFSAEGRLGVRIVRSDGRVEFVPVAIAEDGLEKVWVTGLATGDRVIVQGQDFVKEGEIVEAVLAGAGPN